MSHHPGHQGHLINLSIYPLTLDRWPAFENLFEKQWPVGQCWCMYWRLGNEYRERPSDQNKADFFDVVSNGPPPGLLAFDGDLVVGWCQLTPRDALPWLDHTWRVKRIDDLPVWFISCFYIRKGYRKRGITSAFIRAALQAARDACAPALEAYPLDAQLTPSASGTGYLSAFLRAGFKVVARHVPPLPIVRFDLREGTWPPNPLSTGSSFAAITMPPEW
jgi:GNAT superfamily N-acetyltransferase